MLLAFDLDNTVVTRGDEIPPRILRAVHAARAAGHHIAVLTGRPNASALPFVKQLGVSGPYAVNHGAEVIGADGETLSRSVIPAKEALTLIQTYGIGRGLEYAFMVDDDIYVNDPQNPRWGWAHTLNRNVLSFDPDAVGDADKVVFGADGEGPRMLKELNRDYPKLMTYYWPDGFFEITGEGADKGTALARICQELGVAQRDTVAFGDGVNDVTMMRWAGRSVAVGESHPDVLAASSEQVAEPEEGGVADWIEQNLLVAV